MKKITNIKLHNFRAFFGSNYQLSMPTGENVLIYGENGSGKSSIYNALKDFFESSEKPTLGFTQHIYANDVNEGSVEFTFSELPQTNPTTDDDVFDFNITAATRTANTSSYIKKANKARAFLSYQELVKSYITEKDETGNPNLYNFFIDTLLADYVFTGPNFNGQTIKEKWLSIQAGIDVGDARFYDFNQAEKDIPKYITDLIEQLRIILPTANDYLRDFFKNEIQIDTKELTINRKAIWGNGYARKKVLKLNIFLYDDPDPIDNYHLFLNEARLSAIAICLYLAAIKRSPQPDEYKIIFLDDVFIGLDTSNRIPLLELIKAEFPEHQIFISTYDRFWYETAIRWFNDYMPNMWKSYEMYVNNSEHIAGKIFDKPIMSNAKNNWEKGIYYLQHDSMPDYPSAANSFRKYLEELINKYIPTFETRNAGIEKIEDYKLTSLAFITRNFLNKIGADILHINTCINSLPTLLHPLSHFETKAPIYKRELLIIRDAISNLETQLKNIDPNSNVQCVFAKAKTLRMKYQIEPNHFSYYIIYLNEPLCKYLLAGNPVFSLSSCNYLAAYGNDKGTIVGKKSFKKTNPNFRYISLNDVYRRTHAYLITLLNPHFSTIPLQANYVDAFETSNDGINWHPLRDLLVW